jgi:hypothetical protein
VNSRSTRGWRTLALACFYCAQTDVAIKKPAAARAFSFEEQNVSLDVSVACLVTILI